MLNLFTQISSGNNISFGQKSDKRSVSSAELVSNTPLKGKIIQPQDLFIKKLSAVSFCGSTSKGKFLKPLMGIRDPYSDVIILTDHQMDNIREGLQEAKSIRNKLKVLKEYETSMLPVEKKIFNMFEKESKECKGVSFQDILQGHKTLSLDKLRSEQEQVLKKIEKASKNISEDKKIKIKKELDDAYKRIACENPEAHQFKRKSFIYKIIRHQQNDILDKIDEKIIQLPPSEKFEELEKSLTARELLNYYPPDANIQGRSPINRIQELQAKYIPETLNESDDYTPLIDIAQKLPNSRNNVNAFIVKYFDRSEQEIAERLLVPSVGNIEHIKADSLGGENEAANFMLTTQSRNNERGNKPIQEFIKRYPGIPQYTQHYIDDIINSIHKGKLKEYKWYPYLFKETINQEAGINLDLSNYTIKPKDAFRTCPSRLKGKYPAYDKYIPDNKTKLNIIG